MPKIFKSILLLVFGALLASLVWYLSIASNLQYEAKQMQTEANERISETHLAASQAAQLASLAAQLSMDLQALNSPPEEVHCLILEFAHMKYQKLVAHRSNVPPYVEPIINEYEELEKDASCR